MEELTSQLNDTQLDEKESTILSFGGTVNTERKIIEVFGGSGQPKTLYPDLPDPLDDGKALKLNGYIYLMQGGFTPNKLMQLKADKQLSIMKNLAPLIGLKETYSAAVFCNSLVIVHGYDSKNQNDNPAEYYNTENNEWKVIASTNQKKIESRLVVCRNHLYDIGGYLCSTIFSSVERLKGLDASWEFVQPMHTKRWHHAAVSCNGCIFVMGGSNKDNVAMETMEKYDPTSNTWVFMECMNFERYGHAACVLRGNIYVVGGHDASYYPVKEIERYYPSCDEWEVIGTVDEELLDHSLIVL